MNPPPPPPHPPAYDDDKNNAMLLELDSNVSFPTAIAVAVNGNAEPNVVAANPIHPSSNEPDDFRIVCMVRGALPNSPAESAQMQPGMEILAWGSLKFHDCLSTKEAAQKCSAISKTALENGEFVTLTVKTAVGETKGLSVKPQVWGGPGLIGAELTFTGDLNLNASLSNALLQNQHRFDDRTFLAALGCSSKLIEALQDPQARAELSQALAQALAQAQRQATMTMTMCGGNPTPPYSGGPVPMNQLVANSDFAIQAPQFENEFVLLGTGIYTARNLPSGPQLAFYLPCMLCLGCCIFSSSDLTFDDNTRTVRIKTWSGHLHIFGSGCVSERMIEYEQIGNIGWFRTNLSQGSHRSPTFFYEIMVVLRNGQMIRTGRGEFGTLRICALVLVWHRFVFGRQNPAAYAPPTNPHELSLN